MHTSKPLFLTIKLYQEMLAGKNGVKSFQNRDSSKFCEEREDYPFQNRAAANLQVNNFHFLKAFGLFSSFFRVISPSMRVTNPHVSLYINAKINFM